MYMTAESVPHTHLYMCVCVRWVGGGHPPPINPPHPRAGPQNGNPTPKITNFWEIVH
jgi:hypothetical protein